MQEWRCPYCGAWLGNVESVRTYIAHKGRKIVIDSGHVEQTCHRCGGHCTAPQTTGQGVLSTSHNT